MGIDILDILSPLRFFSFGAAAVPSSSANGRTQVNGHDVNGRDVVNGHQE